MISLSKMDRRNWSTEETRAFLYAYIERKEEFNNVRKKKFAMQNVLVDLESQGVLSQHTTVEMLIAKFKNLVRAYRWYSTNNNRTSGKPCNFPFADLMHDILGEVHFAPDEKKIKYEMVPSKPYVSAGKQIGQCFLNDSADQLEIAGIAAESEIGSDEDCQIELLETDRRSWTTEETRAFLYAYIARKEEFNNGRQKKLAMQNVLVDLESQGVLSQYTTVEMLIVKFKNLVRAYRHSIDTKNRTGAKQFLFADLMDDIFREPETIDEDYKMEQLENTRRIWTIEETRAFLYAYIARKGEFNHVRKKKFAMQNVLVDLESQGVLRQRTTVEMLMVKLKNLVKAYRHSIDNNRTGAKPYNFPFADLMDVIFGEVKFASDDEEGNIPFEIFSSKPNVSARAQLTQSLLNESADQLETPSIASEPEADPAPAIDEDDHIEQLGTDKRSWNIEETRAFLYAYIERKEEFNNVRKKKFAMQRVLVDLESQGVLRQHTTVEMLIDKFKNLVRAYRRSIDRNRTGAKPCNFPFADLMDVIFGKVHSTPKDFERNSRYEMSFASKNPTSKCWLNESDDPLETSSISTESETIPSPAINEDDKTEQLETSKRIWNIEETRAFLYAYIARKEEFNNVRKKKFAMQRVLVDLKSQGVLRQHTTVEMLIDKFKNLVRAYKYSIDNNNTGAKPCIIPFSDLMDVIFEKVHFAPEDLERNIQYEMSFATPNPTSKPNISAKKQLVQCWLNEADDPLETSCISAESETISPPGINEDVKMEQLETYITCRVCMQIDCETVEMDSNVTEDGKTFFDYFNECTQLNAITTDTLPKVLCTNCAEKLVAAYNFRNEAVTSDKELKKLVRRQTIKPASIHNSTEQLESLMDVEKYKPDLSSSQDSIEPNVNQPINIEPPDEDLFSINGADVKTEIFVEILHNEENQVMEAESDSENTLLSDMDENLPLIFECAECPKRFRFKHSLQRHIKQKHTLGYVPAEVKKVKIAKSYITFNCTECPRRYETIKSLRRHMRQMHIGIPINEVTIGQKHTKYNKTNISENAEDDPSSEDLVACKYCYKTFASTEISLHEYKHQRFQLKQKGSYLCSLCPQLFTTEESVKRHEKRIHLSERPEGKECPICHKKFDATYLNFHIESVHTTDRKFVCDICGNSYKTKVYLKEHRLLHVDRRICCPVCNKKFVRPSDLRKHMRCHTGEKRFCCNVCDKRFTFKGKFNYHMQRHAGIKHKCKICGREFNLKSVLTTHSFKHTGMPYRCEVCAYGCAKREVFRRHLLRVHDMTMTPDEYYAMYKANTGRTAIVRTIEELQGEEDYENAAEVNSISSHEKD